jgi:hypothetical protein
MSDSDSESKSNIRFARRQLVAKLCESARDGDQKNMLSILDTYTQQYDNTQTLINSPHPDDTFFERTALMFAVERGRYGIQSLSCCLTVVLVYMQRTNLAGQL